MNIFELYFNLSRIYETTQVFHFCKKKRQNYGNCASSLTPKTHPKYNFKPQKLKYTLHFYITDYCVLTSVFYVKI